MEPGKSLVAKFLWKCETWFFVEFSGIFKFRQSCFLKILAKQYFYIGRYFNILRFFVAILLFHKLNQFKIILICSFLNAVEKYDNWEFEFNHFNSAAVVSTKNYVGICSSGIKWHPKHYKMWGIFTKLFSQHGNILVAMHQSIASNYKKSTA